MPLRLRDNLHWCRCSDRIVFLDVAADRYFCLPRTANDAFIRVAAGQADSCDTERLSVLANRGLLVRNESAGAFRQPPAIAAPVRDVVNEPGVRGTPISILRAFAGEAHAAWQLSNHCFSEVMLRAAERGSNLRSKPRRIDRTIQSIAVAADAIAFVTRSHNRCLVRALAVHAACCARGVRAKLVLGVIAHPFAAHSWVQFGDAVLVGGYEQARLHTPILVIE